LKFRTKVIPINSITRTFCRRRYGVGHLIPAALSLQSKINRVKERNSPSKHVIKLLFLLLETTNRTNPQALKEEALQRKKKR